MHQLTPLPLKQGEKELWPKPQTERSGIAVSKTMNRSPSLQAKIMFATNATLLPLPIREMPANPFELIADWPCLSSTRHPTAGLSPGPLGQHSAPV